MLKVILLEHRLRSGRAQGLVFGKDGRTPFKDRWVMITATLTWVAVLHVTGGYYSYRSSSFTSQAWTLLRSGVVEAAILGFTIFALYSRLSGGRPKPSLPAIM